MAQIAKMDVVNFKEYNATIERLKNLGARERDITAIFRRGTSPLVRAMRAGAGRSETGVTTGRYSSRLHPPGTLRKSVKFKKSRKYKKVYYVLPTSKAPQPDVFYSLYYIGGTRPHRIQDKAGKAGRFVMRGRWVSGLTVSQPPHPFVYTAFESTKETISRNIIEGIYELEKKIWRQ